MRVEASDSYSARPVNAGILLAEVREPAAGRVDLLVEHRDAEVEFLTDGLSLGLAAAIAASNSPRVACGSSAVFVIQSRS